MSQQAPYILGKRIARGGMAEIFLAKAVGSEDFQRVCAVKKILPHYAQEKEYIEMFRTEASICKRLQHANIVQVYDFKKVDDSYAIIMEFVDGADLRTLLAACEKQKIRLTTAMAVYIAAQAARGLHYAHTKIDDVSGKKLEIVHRDISPQNLLLSYEGEVKVIDFGIAKSDSRQQETKPGIVKGKYSYMSPEQVTAKHLDARTDVFSLAIVLWEMLGMKRLFAAETEVETIKNVQNCLIKRSLLDLNPNVDNELNDIILKGLAKDRKRRYDNAADFERDLIKYLNRKFPDFSTSDLGNFVKTIFSQKRDETRKFIQEMMAAPSSTDHVDSANPSSTPQRSSSQIAEIRREIPVAQKLDIMIDPTSTSLPLVVNAGSSISPNSFHRSPNTGSIQSVSMDIFGNPQHSKATLSPSIKRETAHPTWGSKNKKTKWQTSSHGPWAEASSKKAAFYIAGFGIALFVILGFMTIRSCAPSGKANMQISLTSSPAAVAVMVDGKEVDKGKYIETPRRFSLPPGKHTIVLSRENYLSKKIELEGKPGEVVSAENIVLSVDPKVIFTPVIITAKNNERVYLVINEGLYRGFSPMRMTDLKQGGKNSVAVYPNYPEKRGGFRCTFIPMGRGNAFFTLTVNSNATTPAGRCMVTP